MSRPVILCVDDDPVVRAQVEHELTKRYGADYDVRVATSGPAAVALVRSLIVDGRDVALVIADESEHDMTGLDVLAEVGAVSPGTRRALLVRAGEVPMQPSVVRAATFGAIHGWMVKPTAAGLVEEFHHSVGDALYSWSSVHRPDEWVRMVGAAWSPATHEIRDLLARNRVPFGFYDVASEDGQRLLAELARARTGSRFSRSVTAASWCSHRCRPLRPLWAVTPGHARLGTTSSSVPVRLDWPLPCAPPPKGCARSCSSGRQSAGKPAPVR
jgi:CheY-like chemotaxis protein